MLRTLTKVVLIALAMGSLTARGEDASPVSGQYWFDGTGERHPFTPGSFEISTDALQDGLHMLHAFVDNGKSVSSTHTGWFLKRADLKPGDELNAEFYIDGNLFQSHNLRLNSNGMLDIDLDMTDVDLGVHTIAVTVSTPQGLPMGYRYGVFLKVPTDLQKSTFGAYYFLDGEYIGQADTQAANGVYHLDINASALTSGIHSVTAYLASPHGMASSTQTAWFIKIPEGGEGVKQYSYWINDDMESVQTKVLPEVTNPFGLISLVDVPVQPFRSKNYSFAVENQKPVFYACNDFTVRFSDPDGRVSTASRTYTDVRVKQSAEDVTGIANGNVATGKIAANAIKLYQFDAEIGDSIGVRLDRAAMLEVYDPDAGTLIKTTGADATTHRTFTARKNGRYYVAVHDVANGNSATIDFTHIHKFALLEQSVGKSANRGVFETKVTGNGFDSLESLVLTGDGAEYKVPQYRVVDNYTLYALVDIDENPMPLGEYRFKGKFKDDGGEETILSSTALTIEEPTPIDIDVEIKPSFKIGTPYLVSVNVTNRSNVGCWGVPFNLAAQHVDGGGTIDFMDFAVGFDPKFKDQLKAIHETDDLLDTGHSGSFMPTVISYLGPWETQTYTLGLTTGPHALVPLYAWVGKPWSEEAREILADDYDLTAIEEPFKGNLFTMLEFCKLYYQLDSKSYLEESVDSPEQSVRTNAPRATGQDLRNAADMAVTTGKTAVGGAARSANGLISTRMQGRQMLLEMTGENPYVEQMQNTDRGMLNVGNDLMGFGDTGNDLAGNAQALNHLMNARTHWQESVPSDPNPQPNTVDSFQSGDPNDMSGYVSPAGTNHIGKNVKNVTYTIEFENDPEIANAPAARIKVNSTVDGRKLDLSTMRALTLTLGDKEIDLPSGHHFVTTLDMRTAINAIAELTFDFDDKTGETEWRLRSLDPLTLEDITYMGDGILPVNDDSGRGTGYLTFSVDLLPDLKDAETIQSHAVIVFDDNDPISTPVWTNETDYTLPTSKILTQTSEDNQTFNFTVKGNDIGSGIWTYDLYMRRAGTKQWTAVKTQIEGDTFSYTAPEALQGADFAILATDKAGNRQDEAWLDALIGDSDNNGVVEANDAVAIVSHYTGISSNINKINADVTGDGSIDTQDATAIVNLYLLNSKDKTVKKIRIK